jgi:hypothetical protein
MSEKPWFEPRQAQEFSLLRKSRPAVGPIQPPTHGRRVISARGGGVKRLGREADHSPPSSADVKNGWTYTSTPSYTFLGCKWTFPSSLSPRPHVTQPRKLREMKVRLLLLVRQNERSSAFTGTFLYMRAGLYGQAAIVMLRDSDRNSSLCVFADPGEMRNWKSLCEYMGATQSAWMANHWRN